MVLEFNGMAIVKSLAFIKCLDALSMVQRDTSGGKTWQGTNENLTFPLNTTLSMMSLSMALN